MILLFVIVVWLAVVACAVLCQVACEVMADRVIANKDNGRQSWVKPTGRHRFTH